MVVFHQQVGFVLLQMYSHSMVNKPYVLIMMIVTDFQIVQRTSSQRLRSYVARRALIGEQEDRFEANNTDIRLITISTPFGGIKAASHCGSKPLAWLSLGITKLICQIVTGGKYREIPPNSEFITDPGNLIPAVNKHLKIATDESNSCRRFNDRDECVEDDFVFSLDEQSQQALNSDINLSSIIVKSGHVEIIGNGETPPTKLIEILQQQEVLNSTPPEKGEELAQLLTQLYLFEPAE